MKKEPISEKDATRQAEEISPGSFWLVIYEHRPSVIKIAPDRSGFFAVGQEECWPLTEVQAWLRHIPIIPQDGDNATPQT